ncbi:hypothetical protein KJ673_00715 [Patescibacteria group bacterium]|nr:hypothetical protein [Patescibacteria group bacterium]MBU4453136.1 hypothetical protein [Patescibacteria group bacterium]MCG2687345.1 hypothetical protein [Candidatus Parcubacteria bacterium]
MKKMLIIRIAVLVLFFFSIILFVSYPSEMIFNSPDESANATFALEFANHQSLAIPTLFDESWSRLVHPRSAVVVNNNIVPVSFLGLPVLAGLLALIIGSWGIVLLTPILAVVSIIAWRKVIYHFFKNERMADLSALFLLIHPAFWYYSGRVMMHNIGFIAFLIFALYIFACQPLVAFDKYKHFLNEIVAGLCVGLALAFRASEGLWIATAIAGLFVVYRKRIGLKKMVIFGISVVIALLPFFVLNNTLYGSPLATGYTVHDQVSDELIDSSLISQEQSSSVVSSLIFPFGIHEMNIIRNVWHYGFLLYPWMSLLAVLGIIFVFKKKEWRPWITIFTLLSIWLALVYGSWNFHDNPDASVLTIGNSYVRYWLPIFVILSAFSAVGVDKIISWLETRNIKLARIIGFLIIVTATILSARLVIYGSDGFVNSAKSLESFILKKHIVLEQTSDDAIIIVDMADKYLFPDRQVVFPLRDKEVYASISSMLATTEVYYFGITLPEKDIEYLENVVFVDDSVILQEVVMVGDETLYKLILN